MLLDIRSTVGRLECKFRAQEKSYSRVMNNEAHVEFWIAGDPYLAVRSADLFASA